MPILRQNQRKPRPLAVVGPLQQILVVERGQIDGQLGLDCVKIVIYRRSVKTHCRVNVQFLQVRRVDGRLDKVGVPRVDEPLVQLMQGVIDVLPQRCAAVAAVPQRVGDAVQQVLQFPQCADGHLGNDRVVGCFPHGTYPLSGSVCPQKVHLFVIIFRLADGFAGRQQLHERVEQCAFLLRGRAAAGLHQQPGQLAADGAAIDQRVVAVLADGQLSRRDVQRRRARVVAQHILQRCRAAKHRLDQLHIRGDVPRRHAVRGAQLNAGFETYIVKEIGQNLRGFLTADVPGVKLRRNLSARSPDAAQPQRSDLGLGQHVLRIAGVTEIRVHQVRRDAAAVTVHILPEPRADAIAAVAASLIDRGVVAEQCKERRQQAGRAHFADKISLILIVNGHLRRRRGAHHLHAAGSLFLQVGVHGLVPGAGHQGQVLGMAGRVAARRPGAQPVGSQRQPQLQIEAVVQIHDVLHVAQRGQADAQLARGPQRGRQRRAAVAEILAVGDDRRVCLLLQIAQRSLHIGKGRGLAVGPGEKVLDLQLQRQLAVRLTVRRKVARQRFDLFVQFWHNVWWFSPVVILALLYRDFGAGAMLF